MTNNCIFCEIANHRSPAHIIWEDDKHMAFLSIFPNTPGFSVVITKEHHHSYLFELDDEIYLEIVLAARKVGKILDESFSDVGRTGMILEGFGINHAHIKLFPMHETLGEWRNIKSTVNKYFDRYEGYISSHDSVRASDFELKEISKKIRERKKM